MEGSNKKTKQIGACRKKAENELKESRRIMTKEDRSQPKGLSLAGTATLDMIER